MEDDLNFEPGFKFSDLAYRELEDTAWSIFYVTLIPFSTSLPVFLDRSGQAVLCAHFLMINRAAVALADSPA